jgi:hypothetical protein
MQPSFLAPQEELRLGAVYPDAPLAARRRRWDAIQQQAASPAPRQVPVPKWLVRQTWLRKRPSWQFWALGVVALSAPAPVSVRHAPI